MELEKIQRVYFVGIGGIGMSALARYFAHMGKSVAGYDASSTPLTAELIAEGIDVHFNDDRNSIPSSFRNKTDETLVVYTPAVSEKNHELQFFRDNGFNVVKRAKALGVISKSFCTLAVAGTHGKTTTSTMVAHLLCQTPQGCDAFLGGVSKNFASNLVLKDSGSNRLVVEADEFDRSFLHIDPNLAIITSIDADHLDIYGSHSEVVKAFELFVGNIKPGGVLLVKKGLEKISSNRNDIKVYTYSLENESDFFAESLKPEDGFYSFNLVTPFGNVDNLKMGVLGKYNVENAIAASAAAMIWGIDIEHLRDGIATFQGVTRRFEVKYSGKNCIYIDDYAHHPEELKAAIGSARSIFPGRKITGVFQPHLYTRTRDFATEFAQSLSMLDELLLLDIYPAREEPIQGVTSNIIFDEVVIDNKIICAYNETINTLNNIDIDVLLTLGAGNIDRLADDIVTLLKNRGC